MIKVLADSLLVGGDATDIQQAINNLDYYKLVAFLYVFKINEHLRIVDEGGSQGLEFFTSNIEYPLFPLLLKCRKFDLPYT